MVLITGFLGAGKTTLLREILPLLEQKGVEPMVVLNDYRNATIDAATLRQTSREILPINGNCVCCESKDDLMQALDTLPLKPGNVLLLEANGTSDTEQVIELLTADPRASRFTLPVCVGVLDATRWQKRHWNNAVEATQLKFARHVVVSRKDQIDDARWQEIQTGLASLNPRAGLATPHQIADFIATLVHDATRLPSRRFVRPHPLDTGPDHAHAHHFASCEAPLPPTVRRADLERMLRDLPATVLRVKGVAFIEGTPPSALLFQRADTPDSVGLMPLGDTEGLTALAIFIGVDLPVEELRLRLRALESPSADRPAC